MVCASILATTVFISNCEIKIEGSDMMKYDVAEITLDTTCEQTKISLKHAGKLPINAMGHNVVIVEEKNLSKITQQINFSQESERVTFQILKTSFSSQPWWVAETPPNWKWICQNWTKQELCLFLQLPGPWALMRGTIKII